MTRDDHYSLKGDAARIEKLIDRADIEPCFQPIVDLERSEIHAFEALSRPGEGTGFPHAGALFDAADRTGRLWELEHLTRGMSLESATHWRAGQQLFLNCSPTVVTDRRFPDDLLGAVERTDGLTPGRVVIEITERSDQQLTPALVESVGALKSRGFDIAIDDVGAGTSGLNRIMALRPHWLKLDRELVAEIHTDRVRQNLVRFLLDFARYSGVRVIAEGIEQREELEALLDLDVRYAQGFYLGRPGSRNQQLDPALAVWIREYCLARSHDRLRDPRRVGIRRFTRPAPMIDATRNAGDAKSVLEHDAHASGLIVTDGDRPVGWCRRERLERAEDTTPLVGLVGGIPAVAHVEVGVTEALEVAASRDDSEVADPIIVTEAGRIVGILLVRDLMHAGAESARTVLRRVAPLTGLPGRVHTDQHAQQLIHSTRIGTTPPHDAAFIDIRGFDTYNQMYGYELGDGLIRELVSLLLTEVATDDDVEIGHIGNDRFLVFAPAGVLHDRLAQLVGRFDESIREHCSMLEQELALIRDYDSRRNADRERISARTRLLGTRVRLPVGVRAVLIENAFERIHTPKDLHTLAERCVATARRPIEPTSESEILIDSDRPEGARGLAG